MSLAIKVLNVGRINYGTALKLQEYFAKKHLNKKDNSNIVLLLEHNPVYTVGIRNSNFSIQEEERLKLLGADFYHTNRGGLITFHGPGQLITYPILNLKDFKLTMRCYVSNLEKMVISICSNLGLTAYTCQHTGVWINDKKVCAIGVHGSRYITTHGLALNCSLDVLRWFEHIIPCGLEGKGVTSLTQEMKKNYSVRDAAAAMTISFCETFKCNFVDFSREEAAFIMESVLDCADAKSTHQKV
ncbi:hypothetical protein WA026_005088 [Henosepilachna vigintioctopunctata]|uniref:Octanoyl-[acyl-carrier-protein]:protein N-octanoyltransferase LIPT2, mitochondrial n=1 Tax=Henosepilachna vigintioctopunctata TaxID=420089 RepID=A0AAW1UUI3_9CUCU